MRTILLLFLGLVWGAMIRAQNITAVEYFVDTDPGYGLATSVSGFSLGAVVENIKFSVPMGSVPAGVHRIFVRAKDDLGAWSFVSSHMFFREAIPASLPNLSRLEYFIDTDPGYGSATEIPITAALTVNDKNFTIPVDALAPGVHRIFVRAKNSSGNWSVVSSHLFFKESLIAAPVNIARLEYFIDTDPGYGAATEVPVTTGLTVNNKSFSIPVTSLTAGVHRIFVRAKDANGNWSVVSSHLFFKELIPASAPNLVRLEYFIDYDPGYGLATEVPVTPGQLVSNKSFTIPVTSLANGLHRIFLRAKDASGGWSVVSSHLFFKEDIPAFTPEIDKIEFFVDKDPGYGLGFDVPFNSGTREGDKNLRTAVQTLTNLEIIIPELSLETGIHYISVRVRDVSGAWSMVWEEDFKVEKSMPVTLLNFSAQKLENSVNLWWTTTEENNSDHFEIEHSIEGKNWEPIGRVKATGESVNSVQYTFTDAKPTSGINLYRLKMVDKDATFAYSRIVSVEFLSGDGITLFPNPAREHINILTDEPITSYKIMAADGKIVLEESDVNEAKLFQLKFGNLQPGIYVLQLSVVGGKIETRKVIVE